jgi:hypothetical protein
VIETRQSTRIVTSTCISLQSSGKECHVVSDSLYIVLPRPSLVASLRTPGQ